MEGRPPSRIKQEAHVERLQKIGLSARQAEVYVVLLGGPKTSAEIAAETGATTASVGRTLSELARAGLVNRLPGKTTRFALVPPDWVLPTFVQQKEEEVHALRQAVNDVAQLFQSAHEKHPLHPYLEVFAGPQAVLSQIHHLLESTTEESVTFVKPPILSPEAPGVRSSLAQGTRTRSLWEREVLEAPGMLQAAEEWSAAGEEVRVIPSLPAKLLIFDRRVALINVTELDEGRPLVAGLLTRHPELVETLYRLFELLWDIGTPLQRNDKDEGRLESRDRLLACLTAGMTDAAIQRVLGISRRTFSRRVSELLDQEGASSRFEAGFKLGMQAVSKSKDHD